MNKLLYIIIIISLLLVLFACSKQKPFNNPFDPEADPEDWAPSNLSLIQNSVNIFTIKWTDNSNGEQGFKIDRKIDEDNWINEVGIVNENITEFTDSLVYQRDYNIIYYRIYAYLDNINSKKIETNNNIVFQSPTELSYTIININSIELNWVDNSDGEQGFKIDRKLGSSDWDIEYAILSENTENWSDNNAVSNDLIQYRIYAYSGANCTSKITTEEINNIFPSPTNLLYTVVGQSAIELTWSDNSESEDGFIIERKIFNENWIEIGTVSENVTEFNDNNLSDDYIYIYRVSAFFQDFQSLYTDEIAYSVTYIIVPDQFATIQSAINSAFSGDTILIFPGTYVENINYNGKNLTITSLFFLTQENSYISQTIIDGNQNGSVVTINSGEDSSAVLCGFTLTNGSNTNGGGILCGNDSNPTLVNLSIINNEAIASGGGLKCYDITQEIIIKNVLFRNNHTNHPTSAGTGGAIDCFNTNMSLINVTFYSNHSGYQFPSDEISLYTGSNVLLHNCIIWPNSNEDIRICKAGYNPQPSTISVLYSNVLNEITIENGNGNVVWLEGNICADPLFNNQTNGDYHLQPSSPCIDAGNPDSQYNDVDGSRNDMGAYGGPNGNW